MNYRYPLLLLASLFLLAACSSGPETPTAPAPSPITQPPVPGFPTQPPAGGNSISGTVTGPGDVSGTAVIGCFNSDCASPQTVFIETDASGAYTLGNLSAGAYILIAWKDVNGSQAIDNGDYLGAYPSAQSPTAVTPPASSINIAMQIYNDGTAPTDPGTPGTPPTTPPGGGSGISGTVTALPGGDIAGTIVGACPVVGSEADCNSAIAIEISQSGPSAAYSLDDVTAGQYAVLAIQDANGDGSFEAQGVYEQAVTPPATDINIQLAATGNTSLSVTNLEALAAPNALEVHLEKLQKLLE